MDLQAVVAAQLAAGVAAVAGNVQPGVQVPKIPQHMSAHLGSPPPPVQPQGQVPPQGHPPVMPQGKVPVPPAAPTLYQEWFLDGCLDTLRGDYAELNHQFKLGNDLLSEVECQTQELLMLHHD